MATEDHFVDSPEEANGRLAGASEREKSELEDLVLSTTCLHAWQDGTPADWSIEADSLRYLLGQLRPGMVTLETGAGRTTLAFVAAGCRHTSITVDGREPDRITAECRRLGLATEQLSFVVESSDIALSRGIGVPSTTDVVLLDGAHRFPFPAVDFHFSQPRLKVGGLLCVDDYAMPSVRGLHDFLVVEDEWKLLALEGRTAFFRKLAEPVVVNDCQGQRINQVRY